MTIYGTASLAAPPRCTSRRARLLPALVLGTAALAALSLLLLSARTARRHTRSRAATPVRSADRALARMPVEHAPSAVAARASTRCARFRAIGALHELARCLLTQGAHRHDSRALPRGRVSKRHGANAFFAGPLGHPSSPHSFNYACHMPPLRACFDGCGGGGASGDGQPRWRCLMRCAVSNCFVIGDACAKAQFDKCAAECRGRGAFVACAKTCFDTLCPV